MLPTSTPCPDTEELRRLHKGVLPEEQRSHFEAHLRDCPDCQRRWQQLQTETVQDSPLASLARADTGLEGIEARGPSARSLLSPPIEAGEIGWLDIYRVRGTLGEGGMGTVFDAEDTHLQRRVALKVMRPDLAAIPTARQRFLQEARAAAGLSSDHVVTIYRVGQANDVPFLAMELLPGESLEQRLQRLGKLPLADVLRIGREVALGLADAHAQGLIHRDIKPANVFMEARPALGPAAERVKILDFGLARLVRDDQRLTATGMIVGTPSYLSPEQARGQPVDARADLFSLGCVLYRLLTGRLPFDGPDTLSVLTALAVDDPHPITNLRPECPPSLAHLVVRMLARSPADRPQTAREVADVLGALAAGQTAPVAPTRTLLAPPPGGPPRPTRRWSRRHALAAGAVAAIGGVLLALFFLHNPFRTASAGTGQPIKVGVLFSLSGPLSVEGAGASDAITLAIEEINQQGGVLGSPVEAVLVDAASDHDEYPRLAERLIVEDRVSAIFGCWTSVSRKEVRPVLEKHDHLLFFPVQAEGLEESPNIVYLGSTPNQQVLPGLHYATGTLRKRRLFLVGTDMVYPRVAEAIIRDDLQDVEGVRIVGSCYVPFGSLEMQDVVKKIQASKPDLILNLLYGDSNAALLRALYVANQEEKEKLPTLSFMLSENNLRSLRPRTYAGHYAARHYFQSVDRPENQEFVRKFKARFGEHRPVSSPMEAVYVGMHLWKQAVVKAGTVEPAQVRQALRGMSILAPGGRMIVDADNLHTWKAARVGQLGEDGQVRIQWSSESPIRPEPYPSSRSRAEWQKLLDDLYRGWDGHWEGPHS
jgi:urea transport system substrate-binding protein